MSDSTKISIKGLDKVDLLERLWSNRKPASFFRFSGIDSPSFDKSQSKLAIKGYIDYFCGRCIKIDISGDEADYRLYDRDCGKEDKTFQQIVSEMKS